MPKRHRFKRRLRTADSCPTANISRNGFGLKRGDTATEVEAVVEEEALRAFSALYLENHNTDSALATNLSRLPPSTAPHHLI